MATSRILLAEGGALAEVARSQVADSSVNVVPLADGARCLGAFTKLARAGRPPVLVAIAPPLARVDGQALALSIRAVERALGVKKPTPLLLYDEQTGEQAGDLVGQLGRAVHLQRPADQPPAEQGRRLGLAITRLLGQIRGK